MNDGQLLAQFAEAGDQAAFRALVERYLGLVGKGRIVVGQWLRFPHELDTATRGRFYIHCLQWLAGRAVE